MKKNLKLGGVLILLVLFSFSCQKENYLDKAKVAQDQSENKGTTLKTTEQFEFGISLFTQDEPEGPVVAATGTLTIESNGVELYNGTLVEGINRIVISNEPIYNLKIEKEGYVTYQHEFTYAELEVHKIQRYTVPLEVVLEKENEISVMLELSSPNFIHFQIRGPFGKMLLVDWGDGSSVQEYLFKSGELDEDDVSHGYKNAGSYRVRITGDIDAISSFSGQGYPQQYFITEIDLTKAVNLQWLTLNWTNLSSIDLSHNVNLISVYISNNKGPFTGFDISNNSKLTALDCRNIQFTNFDINNSALRRLTVTDCQLQTLDLSNVPGVYQIYCGNNQLTNLDISNNAELVVLNCENNQLTSLDLSNNTKIAGLDIDNNQISSLDLANNLFKQSISCRNNHLTSLDLRNIINIHTFSLNAEGNPDLTTICVDDVDYANYYTNINRWTKDATANYSNCN